MRFSAEQRPRPNITAADAPFYEYAKRGELRMPECQDCRTVNWPSTNVCHNCLGARFEWKRLSGKGTVTSFVIFREKHISGYEPPYAVAEIQLDEGPRYMSNIVDCGLERIQIGMRVIVAFERLDDEFTLPQFRPK